MSRVLVKVVFESFDMIQHYCDLYQTCPRVPSQLFNDIWYESNISWFVSVCYDSKFFLKSLVRFNLAFCPRFWPSWYISVFLDSYQSSSGFLWYGSKPFLWKFESIQTSSGNCLIRFKILMIFINLRAF